MKALVTITLAVVLAVAIIAPVSVNSAASPNLAGQVVVGPGDTTPTFSGDIKLLSDGTVTGDWEWTLFYYGEYQVGFRSNEFTGLSFPDAGTATFTGTFASNDLPLDFTSHTGVESELRFVITDSEALIGTDANPGGLPVILPPGTELPPGFGIGGDTLLAYCGDELIAVQRGNYQVNVY